MSQILSKMSSEKTDLTVFVVVPVEGEGSWGGEVIGLLAGNHPDRLVIRYGT